MSLMSSAAASSRIAIESMPAAEVLTVRKPARVDTDGTLKGGSGATAWALAEMGSSGTEASQG